MFKLRISAVLTAIAVALACASCGSSSEPTTVAAESGKEVAAEQSKPTRISTGVPFDRRVVVSKSAKSLYAFEREPKGGDPACYGKCAKEWPPYLTASGKLEGIGPVRFNTALLGTVKRRGGSLQVTYAGHPLYEYAHEGVTDIRGFMRNEFGGSWYLLGTDGALLTRSSSGRTVRKGESVVSNGKAEGLEKGGSVVSTAKVKGLGTVLVTAEGLTIYDVRVDKGTTANCYGECTDLWRPLLADGRPQARGGVIPVALGTTRRKDGTIQVTYSEHPLYTSRLDKGPGERQGEDPRVRKGRWTGYVLNPDGEEAFR